MRHVVQPLGGERSICPTCVNSEVSVITVGQVCQRSSVLKLISKVKNSPKPLGKGLLFEEVRIFKEAEQKSTLRDKKTAQVLVKLHRFWIVLFVKKLIFVLF